MAENDDISTMVEKIMSNPEFADLVRELRSSENGAGASEPAVSDVMAHLPDIMSMLRPIMGESANEASTSPENTEKLPAAIPKKYDKARAEKLMAALKPYLNPSRCEIIDRCVSVMQITDVVGALQGMENLTKSK